MKYGNDEKQELALTETPKLGEHRMPAELVYSEKWARSTLTLKKRIYYNDLRLEALDFCKHPITQQGCKRDSKKVRLL